MEVKVVAGFPPVKKLSKEIVILKNKRKFQPKLLLSNLLKNKSSDKVENTSSDKNTTE